NSTTCSIACRGAVGMSAVMLGSPWDFSNPPTPGRTPPRVVTGSPPVVDLDAPLAVVDPPVPAPDLVVAGHVLHRAARRRVEVVRFEVHGERRRPGQVGSEWA